MAITPGTWTFVVQQPDESVWLTIRRVNGNWMPPFSKIQNPLIPGGPLEIALADRRPEEMHIVVLVATGGELWHSLISSNGWTQFGDVALQTGGVKQFISVGAAPGANVGELHLVAGNVDGRILHTLRRADGSWTKFGDVEAQSGQIGQAPSLGCAFVASQGLHVVVVTDTFRIFHALRRPDGSWTPFGDVESQTGDVGNLLRVDCAASSDGLHVCAIRSDHRLFHTLRRNDGTWTPFGDVEAVASKIDPIQDVSCATDGQTLHVAAVTSAPATIQTGLFHTLRRPDGSWVPFGDVLAAAGPLPGRPYKVCL